MQIEKSRGSVVSINSKLSIALAYYAEVICEIKSISVGSYKLDWVSTSGYEIRNSLPNPVFTSLLLLNAGRVA